MRSQSRLCLLCGSQHGLQSFKNATMKHSSIKFEMNKMSKLFPSYIVHAGKPVKSGLNFIFKKAINCMDAIQSASCTGLAFGTDLMCANCQNIFREPAVRLALIRLLQRSKIGETYNASSTDILTSVKQHGIYCSKDHPGHEIIFGTAEMY